MGKNEPPRNQLLGSLFDKSVMQNKKKSWEKFIQKLEIMSQYTQQHGLEFSEVDEVTLENLHGIERQVFHFYDRTSEVIFKRNESRLLEDGHFKCWSAKLFQLFLEMRGFIPKETGRKFIRDILNRDLPEIKKNIRKYKSDLGEKLILRKKEKCGGMKSNQTLILEIRREWERLLNVMMMEDLVVYSLDVLNCYKKTNSTRKAQK